MSAFLLVTRDSAVRQLVQQSMQELRHQVLSIEDSEQAIQALASVEVDLLLLDGAGGSRTDIDSLSRWLTTNLPAIPILFLTASPPGSVPTGSSPDRVLHRPLAAETLREAIVLALRDRAPAGDIFSVGDMTLIGSTHELSMDGARVSLTRVQFRLLETLARHDGSAVSLEELQRSIWGDHGSDVPAGLLRSHVYLLRSKLRRSLPRDPIETVPRRGYRLG